jgi:general stress protein 26
LLFGVVSYSIPTRQLASEVNTMTTAAPEKLQELLHDFDAAMLVTQTAAGGLRSRPMALAAVDPDGVLWFLTQRGSGKMHEIARDEQVNVAMQSKLKFVSISGTISPVENRAKVAELWNPTWKTWFPGGQEDPDLILLRVQGNSGEYWDNSGASGLKYLIEAGKAYLSGTRPEVEDDPSIHGKVAL